MIRVEQSVTVNRPVEEVFAFAGSAFVQNLPKWSTAVQEFRQTSPGPLGVGTTAHQVRLVNGKPTESNTTVTEFEPNRKLTFRSEGSVPAQGTYTFEPAAGGTKVSLVLEMEPGGFGRLAGPIIGRQVKKDTEADLGRMKSLIETGAAR
jgi:uncharacterized membrane protein